jgi:hypothetical protein
MSKLLFWCVLVFFMLPSLYAEGGKEQKKEPKMFNQREGAIKPDMIVPRPPPGTPLQEIEISGIVRLIGSGPGMELVISDEANQWHTEAAEQSKLRNLQQRTVTVKAKTYTTEIIYSGDIKIVKRYLRDITVLPISAGDGKR